MVRRYPEPPPALASERLHVFVRFPREYAVVTIEDREGRLVALPTKDGVKRYALVERWIADRAEDLFPGREVIETFPFKIIRDADLRWRPDDEDDLESQILEAVNRRVSAKVVRLEVDSPAYSEGALFLATQHLEVMKREVNVRHRGRVASFLRDRLRLRQVSCRRRRIARIERQSAQRDQRSNPDPRR